uniref:Uncharacterized protein n=1 Tax=Anguilla anguilla TaxID=7936 RepID=A0A0E9QSM1_ANGAN
MPVLQTSGGDGRHVTPQRHMMLILAIYHTAGTPPIIYRPCRQRITRSAHSRFNASTGA